MEMASLLARHRSLRLRLTSRLRFSATTCSPLLSPRNITPTIHTSHRFSTKVTQTVDHNILDPSRLIEEETFRSYNPSRYYPVTIGSIFQDRYSIIGKLGYGSTSTVWLCHDLHSKQHKEYVALKIYTNNSNAHRELSVYKHINSLSSQHAGRAYVRKLLDSFEINGPHGKHVCLVHEALGMNLSELRDLVPGGTFGADLIRECLRDILRALHFLHEEAGIVHTDIQPKNILLGVLDETAFTRFENDERCDPMPRKELPSHTVYMSRPMPLTKGAPSLCDLSEARFGDSQNVDLVMPDVYRAPEVLLGMPWGYSVDLWGFAMMLWDLLEPKRLFSPHRGDGIYDEQVHVAQTISILGPAPRDFIARPEKRQRFWDDEGKWKGDVPIPETSLEKAETRLQGEEKELFLAFLRKMLQWKPEDRKSIREVFEDEWLLADLIESGEIVRD